MRLNSFSSVVLSNSCNDSIIAHCKSEFPIEACGYLLGRSGVIADHYVMTNVDQSETRFSFDPAEQFEAVRKARELRVDIVGIYHSHPTSKAEPSEEDVRLAQQPDMLHVIVSLKSSKIDVKAFEIIQGIYRSVELIIK